MPGVVGLITKMPRKQAVSELVQMIEVLRHESFYVTGMWTEDGLGVYVGWVARKDSFGGEMPVRNEQGDVLLVFSGEEFPESDTKQRLEQRGHDLDRVGPSYLVHLYEDDESSFPACLNGMFQGVLIDRRQGTTSLFNDRYGMQRIYYHESKEAFYFAAEAKAILAVRPELRRLDFQGVGEFLTWGCVLEDRTLFEGVHVLPGGSAWVFRNGSLEKKKSYFQPREWEYQSRLDPGAYYRELREVFSKSLPRYFGGQNRIAISLTGGLDTRMIIAWYKPVPGALPCYTFGGMYRECRDVFVARQVARACRQPHEVITVGEHFLTRFPSYAERTVYLTDGCAEVSHAPALYAHERAREIAPVRMTGNYGGEVLRAVGAFNPVELLPQLFHPYFLPYIQQAGATYARLKRMHPLSFSIFRQVPWHYYGQLALEQSQVSLRSPYLDNELVRTVFRAPGEAFASDDICLRLVADGNPALRRIPTDRGIGAGELGGWASRGLLEFLFKAEYAYDLGMPQWLARLDHLLSPLRLERLFLGRHKFYHFRVWYRDALSRYVQEMLLDRRTLFRPYLQRSGVEAVVQGHTKGNRNYSAEIHKLLTLELVQRLFLDPL